MTIEHKNIVDPEQHEPKGAATASSGQLIISDGAGGTSWQHGASNTHGEIAILAKTETFTPTGTNITDTANYTKVTAASLWSEVVTSGMTFDADELVLLTAGTYFVDFWINFSTAAAAGTLYGFKYVLDDTSFSTRTLRASKNSGGTDDITISAAGIISGVTAGQILSIYGASSATTNVSIQNAGMSVFLIKES